MLDSKIYFHWSALGTPVLVVIYRSQETRAVWISLHKMARVNYRVLMVYVSFS